MFSAADLADAAATFAATMTTPLRIWRAYLDVSVPATPVLSYNALAPDPVGRVRILHYPTNNPPLSDMLDVRFPLAAPLRLDDRLIWDNMVWRAVDHTPLTAAGTPIAEKWLFGWYATGTDPGGTPADYNYLKPNAWVTVTRNGAVVYNWIHVHFTEPQTIVFSPSGVLVAATMDAPPGTDIHFNDKITVVKADGHASVGLASHYTALLPVVIPDPGAKVHVQLTGGLG